MDHTKEPWIKDNHTGIPTNIFSEVGMRVARCDFDGDHESLEAQANARRIVACVNACIGIDTETLEAPGSLAEIIRNRKSQFDELLAALTEAANDYISQNGSRPSWWTNDIAQIAKNEANN